MTNDNDMKIAYCIRPEYKNGGDGVQAIKTKEYIEKAHTDISIDILTEPSELKLEYDLVHIFNYATTDLTRAFFQKAASLGLKIVSSPVFWDYSYSMVPFMQLIRFNKSFITEDYVQRQQKVSRWLSSIPIAKLQLIYNNVSKKFRNNIRAFIKQSVLILPNSMEEGEKCCDYSGAPESWKSKIRVVYNGVDVSGVEIVEKEAFFRKYGLPDNYVLQVGRLEYLKNALNLIGALMDYPEIPIVFVGNDRGSEKYSAQLRKMSQKRGNVFFISNVPHDEIYSFYRYAKVHVLLSMRESPGLVSLEALSQGCPIVVSDERFCPVKTYFGEQCEIVNPYDKEAIGEAVLHSMKKPHITVDLSRFSWEAVARQTMDAYKEVLG